MGNRIKKLFQRKIIRRLVIVFMILAVAGGIFLYFYQRKLRWYHYKYPLHDAAYRGNVKKVKRLIQRGAPVNEGDHKLRTPLHLALLKKNKEATSFLLSRGARVNVRDRTGETPLHVAILMENKDLVDMLIRHGADPDIPWDNGVTPLCGAIGLGYADIAESLIKAGADMNARTTEGYTALLCSVGKKNKDLSHLLLDRGAEVNIISLDKRTPLSLAIDMETSEIVHLLLDHGAEVKPHERDKPSLLCEAADKGNYEIAKSLIDAGADVNDFSIVKGEKEYIPLHHAVAKGHRKIVQLLLDHGADKESLYRDRDSPLFTAAFNGQKEIFKMLVDAGARIDAREPRGIPALCLSANVGRPEVIEMFLDQGADVDIRTTDSQEVTPLYYAAQYGQEKAARILLSHHADVNARDKMYGFTPLHLAVMRGDEAMTQLLVSYGADESIRDVFGLTPGEWHSRMKEIREKRLEEAREKEHHFDPRAILIMVCMGGPDNRLCSHSQAFCIGDGTLLITTAHSASHFVSSKMERRGNSAIVFSPYYGDAFEAEVVAIDQEHDVAILRAPWKSHPALALAKSKDLEKLSELLITGHSSRKKREEISDIVQEFLINQIDIIKGILNRTPKKDKERTRDDIDFSRNARVERFSLVKDFPDEKNRQLLLAGARFIAPGWSGSPIIISEDNIVIGCVNATDDITEELDGAIGANVRSIRSLLEEKGLLQIAEANRQVKDAPEDADKAFSLLLEWIESYERDDDVLAFRELREFVSLRPASVQGRLFLAYSAYHIYEMNTFREEYKTLADENFREALKLAPQSPTVHTGYGYFLRRTERFEEALVELNKSRELESKNDYNHRNLIRTLNELKPEEAENICRDYIQQNSDNDIFWRELALVLEKREKYQEAFQAAQKAIDLFPDQYYWVWQAQARALTLLGKIEEAGNFYRRILLQEPDRYYFWYHYCKFLIENQPQNKSEAVWALDRAESLYKPEEGPRYKDLRELREKMDQIKKQDKEIAN